jgi:fido (protein-threonine AMPylation protein)
MTYAELADAIAPNLLSLLEDIADGKFHAKVYDEELIKLFHQRIVGDILPDIAGKWRDEMVQVGNHIPPMPHELSVKMREYAANIQERLRHANSLDLQLELLTYAEGEFLNIHPFKDFNGRTIRALLEELLFRLDLPKVAVSVLRDTQEFKDYQHALAEYDNGRMQALVNFWGKRFEGIK